MDERPPGAPGNGGQFLGDSWQKVEGRKGRAAPAEGAAMDIQNPPLGHADEFPRTRMNPEQILQTLNRQKSASVVGRPRAGLRPAPYESFSRN